MTEADRDRLRADCANCAALCCVAPALTRSADFAIDKPAGQPCPNLAPDFRCTIHADLRFRGFPGCASYDCFGAGQRVTRELFADGDWRAGPDTAARMFAAFSSMRRLHELRWYLAEALELPASEPLRSELRGLQGSVEAAAASDLGPLLALDVDAVRRSADSLLERVSALARAAVPPPRTEAAAADLIGRNLRREQLRGADLRGAYLIGADLRGVDLELADLTGADLRGARIEGADLRRALFLTQTQVGSARGDSTTLLPPSLLRPPHFEPPALSAAR